METFCTLLALYAGNSLVPGEFPSQRLVTPSFDVFFDLRLKNGSVNTREAGDLRRYRAHYDVIIMKRGTPASNRKGCIVESSPSDEDDDHHNDHDHDCVDDDDWCWGGDGDHFPLGFRKNAFYQFYINSFQEKTHSIISILIHLNRRWPGPLPVYDYFVEVIPCSLCDPIANFDTINYSI